MAHIKTKGSMDKPKVKTSGFVPKEAKSIIKEKYQEQQERNAPGQKDPVRYATDKVESGGKRATRTAGDAIKQKAKKEFAQQRHRKADHNHSGTSEPLKARDTQPSHSPGQTPEPTTQSAAQPAPNQSANYTGSYGRTESPTQYNRRTFSTTSTNFSTTNSVYKNKETQNIVGRSKELGRKKAIKDAQKSKAKKTEQRKFSTRDQAHRTESSRLESSHSGDRAFSGAGGQRKPLRNNVQAPMGHRGATDFRIPAVKDSGLKSPGPEPGSKAARSLKADGNRPKFGAALQKRRSPFQRSKAVQRQLSPAKALARRRAQKEMVKKAGQRTRQAATKAGKTMMQFAQAVGRVALAAVKGVLAAGGGVILLIVLLCLILVAAIAASPFGIFFAGGGSQDGVPVSVAVAQVNYAYNETLE